MIEPLQDYVLIERIEEAPKGLIVIPDVAREKSIKGKVLAVGPGKRVDGIRKPVDVKVGELVLFNSKWSEFSSSHYADDQLRDRKLHLVMEADIFGKVNAPRSS